ncbi:glycoside hydrolase family 18 [Fusarium acutatum]|uniref:Glycoside hydrolase family 18 n=1 Tax=Fusarium acutatum TaxID=78861 RepID=A0A8H4J844_9HYPO|nr:glycoside hydrolase family 18 [Fusarium acutatum]
MGYQKKTVVSLFTCALLIPSLLIPYVTASYPSHHPHLDQTDREVGNEDVQGKSKGYLSEGIHVPESLAPHEVSSAPTQGGTPRKDPEHSDFDLVDLARLFPEGHMPLDSSDLQYGLTTLGSGSKSGAVDTASSGSGYLLAVGESHGLSQLRKRDGQPDPFVFLDCPANVLDQPVNQTQKARVVCTSEDVDGCFRVMERGVEGTLVEMPEDCAANSFARAVSLELAEDQTMPDRLANKHTLTSPIYQFSFDFNKHELRADANVAIRMEMTNVNGHLNGFIDSPGVEKRDFEGKYISSLNLDWKNTLQQGHRFHHSSRDGPYRVVKDLSTPVFWQAAKTCPVGDKHYDEGIGAFIQGKVDANLFYAITAIATSSKGSSTVKVTDAYGVLHVTGQTDLTFGIGGMGHLNIGMAGKGNPARSEQFYEGFQSETISAGASWGTMKLTPFIRRQSSLATSPMDESLSTTDLGNFPATFPRAQTPSGLESMRKIHKETEMESFNNNTLYGDGGERGSTIQIGHNLTFGLNLFFNILPDMQGHQPAHQSRPTSLLVTSETQARSLLRQSATGKLIRTLLGWKKYDGSGVLFADNQAPYHEPCFSTKSKRSTVDFPSPGNQSAAISINNLNKRGLDNPKQTFGSVRLRPIDIFGHVVAYLFNRRSATNKKLGEIDCRNGLCGSCLNPKDPDGCCGCVCMQCKWGPRGDMPPCEQCTDEGVKGEAEWPGPQVKRDRISGNDVPEYKGEGWAHFLKNLFFSRARSITLGWKVVKVNNVPYFPPDLGTSAPFKYPQFPKDVKKVWEGADGGVYDPISYYWGNTSADCSDWSIGLNTTRDQTYDDVHGWIPSPYQSKFIREPYSMNATANMWCLSQAEHVYEGQNLGQFFTEWLTKGQVHKQQPYPGTTNGKVDAAWIEAWIMSPGEDLPWVNPEDPSEEFSFFGLLHAELGNIAHKDRLAILLERLNRKKENVFDLSKCYSTSKYKKMSTDEQWSTVKEIGLTFNYLNNDTIWGMWCDTFVGVYDWLDYFDKYYALVKGLGDPDVSLAEEWGKYNRVVLDSAVKINSDGWDWTFENRQ